MLNTTFTILGVTFASGDIYYGESGVKHHNSNPYYISPEANVTPRIVKAVLSTITLTRSIYHLKQM
jgi:hypothetical protein